MKKIIFFVLGLAFICSGTTSLAQEVLDGVYIKNHVRDRKPVPYQYLREADIMWSKIIWRKIDLREKINQHLYFPTEPLENGNRMSLVDLLMWGIKNQGLQAYDLNGSDEFGKVLTMKEIEENLGAKETVQSVEDVTTGQTVEKKIRTEGKTSDVKQYLIKELWYFDKQRSVLEARIIGLCPIIEFFKDEDVDQEDPKYRRVFWVYFPEARKILANHEVYNPINDADRKTFDDIFFKRYFSSFIYQESNLFNNRRIEDYTIGLEALLEADRIKESIFNFEQDLWEY